MNRKKILKSELLFCLALLACNIPVPTGDSGAGLTAESATLPPAADEGAKPSGLPLLTLQPGSGYFFATGEVVTGSDPRDIWWNAVGLVPGSMMASAGILDSPAIIDQISGSGLEFRQFEPVPGETFVVEISDGSGYALIRCLSRGDSGEITLEYLYPYAGQVLP